MHTVAICSWHNLEIHVQVLMTVMSRINDEQTTSTPILSVNYILYLPVRMVKCVGLVTVKKAGVTYTALTPSLAIWSRNGVSTSRSQSHRNPSKEMSKSLFRPPLLLRPGPLSGRLIPVEHSRRHKLTVHSMLFIQPTRVLTLWCWGCVRKKSKKAPSFPKKSKGKITAVIPQDPRLFQRTAGGRRQLCSTLQFPTLFPSPRCLRRQPGVELLFSSNTPEHDPSLVH